MRTTLTIDDRLAAELKRRAFETGKSFKAIVNETLQKGLAGTAADKPRAKRYKTRSVAMGAARVDLTHALRIAGEMEDEEIARKLERRK